MKLNISNIKVFLILSILVTGTLLSKLKTAVKSTVEDNKGINPNVETVKFLFMYKYPEVRNEKKHKLNLFTYKNVLFSNDQMVFFASPNQANETKDPIFDTSKYLMTMRYEYLDAPCLNKSFICTHSQFLKEYKSLYPEINFEVPKEVLEKFGDATKASESCLILIVSSFGSLEEAAWLCHPDSKLLLQTQLKLSKIVLDANIKDYDFVATYVQNKSTLVQGMMTLQKDKFSFTDFEKKEILTAEWKDVEPYANSMYLKESLIWTGDKKEKPDDQRCLKILRTSEVANNNPDYFCAYFHRNDVTEKVKLSEPQGRFAAEMYTNKINIRLHHSHVKKSLLSLAKMDQKSIEVDSKALFPIKMGVRKDYFIQRHELLVGVKLGQIKKNELDAKLKEAKDKVIYKICGGIELCTKAIGFCADKDLLPMKGIREKFAMDIQNPFNRLMPQVNIKIDIPKPGSVGKEIVTAVAQMKGALNYFAEPVSESAPGEIPNHIAIKKAFSTFNSLREKKEYKKLIELQTGCKASEMNNSNNIRRKVSFLMYAGDNDIFFEYLGYIRDFQLTKK